MYVPRLHESLLEVGIDGWRSGQARGWWEEGSVCWRKCGVSLEVEKGGKQQ